MTPMEASKKKNQRMVYDNMWWCSAIINETEIQIRWQGTYIKIQKNVRGRLDIKLDWRSVHNLWNTIFEPNGLHIEWTERGIYWKKHLDDFYGHQLGLQRWSCTQFTTYMFTILYFWCKDESISSSTKRRSSELTQSAYEIRTRRAKHSGWKRDFKHANIHSQARGVHPRMKHIWNL